MGGSKKKSTARADEVRARRLLAEASELLGKGKVLLQIWSSPVVEWVYVGLEDGAVVASDNGQTFGWISGQRRLSEPYLPWSIEKARIAARRFGVEVSDESGEGYEAFRLIRVVGLDDSVPDVVQAIALAIDGTLALHTQPGSPRYDAYFWDRTAEDG